MASLAYCVCTYIDFESHRHSVTECAISLARTNTRILVLVVRGKSPPHHQLSAAAWQAGGFCAFVCGDRIGECVIVIARHRSHGASMYYAPIATQNYLLLHTLLYAPLSTCIRIEY